MTQGASRIYSTISAYRNNKITTEPFTVHAVRPQLVIHHLVDVFHRVGRRHGHLGHAASTAAPADRVTRAALYGGRDTCVLAVQYRHLDMLRPQSETQHILLSYTVQGGGGA